MIVVKVELWPGGLESRARELARLYIARTTKEAGTRADYKVAVMRRGETKPPWPIGFGGNTMAKPIRTGTVVGHARKALHVLTLVGKAIDACFPSDKVAKGRQKGQISECPVLSGFVDPETKPSPRVDSDPSAP